MHSLKKLEEKIGPLVEELWKSTLSSAPGLNLMRPKDNEELLDSGLQNNCRSGVGMLLYLAKYTRSDIANAVQEHSRMINKATELRYMS